MSKAERTIANLGGAISASKPVAGVSGEPQIAARVDPPPLARSRRFRLRVEWVRRSNTARTAARVLATRDAGADESGPAGDEYPHGPPAEG